MRSGKHACRAARRLIPEKRRRAKNSPILRDRFAADDAISFEEFIFQPLTFLFTFTADLIIRRKLGAIDMVESLKAIE